jgi:hypothetical protein
MEQTFREKREEGKKEKRGGVEIDPVKASGQGQTGRR